MTAAYKYKVILEKEAPIKVCENELIFDDTKTDTPEQIYDYIVSTIGFGRTPNEQMGIIALNVKNMPIGFCVVSSGGLNFSGAHPREVFAFAIAANAASIILTHNHPSGDPTPSSSDIATTKQLSEAGKILGIPVLDHIIIGEGNYTSLNQQGNL